MDDHSHHDAPKEHPDQHDDERRISYFASTHTRGRREMFGIRAVDRGKHMYVIGKTGMGKSTMLENMAIQDIQNGEGIAFIDPHGSTAEKLLDFIPEDRIKDVVYFAPFDTDYPMGFNVMEDVGYDKRHLVVSGLMGALKRIWVDAWSARMEYILQNTLLALLEYPGSTLIDVNRMLTNKTFRQVVIDKITDPIVRSFWVDEFAAFTDTYTREATPAIQNKIGQFVSNPLVRNIVGQAKSTFDMRKIMDEKKIFIVNLSKGRMGETNASLLGSMLTVKIYLAAMSRADEPAARMAKLPRFYFYVDEFQSMMNEAFADILSESRKYKLALTLANQYIEQMEEEVRDAVFGNVGTLVCFRVGPFDAEVLKTVFEPTFFAEDLVGLGLGQIYLTLMIDGVGSPPFSAETIPPIEAPSISYRDDVVSASRVQYARPRSEVESYINTKQAEFVMPPKEKKPTRDYRPGGGGSSSSNSSSSERRDAGPDTSAPRPGGGFRDSGSVSSQGEVGRTPAPHGNTSSNNGPQQTPREGWHAERPQQPVPSARPAVRSETPSRNTLKEAIEKARRESAASAPAATPVRSPLDVLRERTQRHAQSTPVPHTKPAPIKSGEVPSHRPHKNTDASRAPHTPSAPEHELHTGQEPRPKQDEVTAPPPTPAPEKDLHDGEVSHRVLQRVLNGHGRDNDDL